MINRKYLKELGCKEDMWPETGYNSLEEIAGDKRLAKHLVTYEKTGVNPIDTWNFDQVALMWMYERLIVYKKAVTNVIDMTFYTYNIDGKEYTQGECIDMLIELGEYLIAEPDNLSKKSKAYKRVTANPHYVKYHELKNAKPTYSKKYEREIDGYLQAVEYELSCNQKFWDIWAKIWPTMWW